ncbi:hypothetical protein SAMN04487904_108117 [Actinopolyspora lacussalsi subsp. righensis]|uniref:Uncharacterized protein n=1 Tax=Actinopolyspora righensis TaxID=995060 RepID=A0A1I7AUY4_9ACTN|nr:hypothetical protein SAMN04487904_108117 [Actinopolyspora righensis]
MIDTGGPARIRQPREVDGGTGTSSRTSTTPDDSIPPHVVAAAEEPPDRPRFRGENATIHSN